MGLGGVTAYVTGTDTLGNAVDPTRITASDRSHSFAGLELGTYTVSEVQPSGYVTTANAIATVNGTLDVHLTTSQTDAIDRAILQMGDNGLNYDFGEIATGCSVAKRISATFGFWHGNNGESLINSFNGGSTSTALGNWLAGESPNLYGSSTGSNNMTGKTNA